LLQQGRTEEAIINIQKALELQPADASVQNTLAWVLATAPQSSLRNGARALELATKANQSAGGNDPNILRTLAAAYAGTGKFADAARSGRNALQLAEALSNAGLANALRREIKLYEADHRFEEVR